MTRYLLTSYQPDFAVMRGGQLLGVVRRAHVLQALALQGQDLRVSEIMRPCPTVSADLTLDETRRVLGAAETTVAAVFNDYGFVGLVSLEDIAEAETVLAFTGTGGTGSAMPFKRTGGLFRRPSAATRM